MSKPDALAALTQHNANKIASLSPEQFAIFQTLEAERAAEKGESVADKLAFIDLLKTIGNANAVESGTPATDKTVEIREQEKRLTEGLEANGKTPDEIEGALAAAKQAGILMAGIGALQATNNTVTPVSMAKVRSNDDLPGH